MQLELVFWCTGLGHAECALQVKAFLADPSAFVVEAAPAAAAAGGAEEKAEEKKEEPEEEEEDEVR